MERCVVVFVTCPSLKSAKQLAQHVVKARVAACVNILPEIRSLFRWQGKVDQAKETLLLIKTTARRFPALKRHILRSHPYDVPEVIALPVVAAHRPYTTWVAQSVRGA
ncbi:MAG TPA: divalent-cation tolerance protein CutA [Candidatus Omnitrophica bacterium]|nr:MAG: cation tolerance protein CutA [Omnitrophica WOR_2 bacterium GWA2_63_20]OGX17362.1 MAG: cation tolerance protein CutA [Omnitrophica WOR_2 bacterium GWF2_63_9]OGX30989.1 MAG: cation tolerance protein CutA [Omnitrophica WOR_2 bacterium RIFCSPHIGHO2_12_FULL_64_13]OGX36580.1 MAG: cation tolerance protein CutA [Omnitrophica WOR_2 bacterium RIFCSPHIGHO2_02_FULL_63_39]OGX46008.1 MAG: cation tolerance protein CutA [Omnitrophica WOR_2 bacterium RIFCSPLOWO2_02_FULL_63_16]OGX47326.1 MAG: cation to